MYLTIDQLIAAIEASTVTIKYLVESTDFYRRPGDTENEYRDVVDASALLEFLEGLPQP